MKFQPNIPEKQKNTDTRARKRKSRQNSVVREKQRKKDKQYEKNKGRMNKQDTLKDKITNSTEKSEGKMNKQDTL